MATDSIPYLSSCFVPKTKEEEEEDERTYQRYRDIISTFPSEKGWLDRPYYHYQGFWYNPDVAVGALAVQYHFKAHPSDILLVTTPKSGTTWLKALTFAFLNRKSHPFPIQSQHPLLTFNPHDLVLFLEATVYNNSQSLIPNLEMLPPPRLFATHMPYTSLPKSVFESGSRIVYLCRNAKDTFVSVWHFVNKMRSKRSLVHLSLEESFEWFCNGKSIFRPFWDQVLGYWKGSRERPQTVLFFKYEEMKAEPAFHLKRLAEFIGFPFSLDEQKEGVVDEIIRLCSFENLSTLEVNVTGEMPVGVGNKAFFRRGKVGDSARYLTLEMIELLDRITEQKLKGSGLTL